MPAENHSGRERGNEGCPGRRGGNECGGVDRRVGAESALPKRDGE